MRWSEENLISEVLNYRVVDIPKGCSSLNLDLVIVDDVDYMRLLYYQSAQSLDRMCR
jgi:hypothetical protein